MEGATVDRRLIIRSISDFTVRAGVIGARAFDRDDVTALIVSTIYSGNAAHLRFDEPAALAALPGMRGGAASLRPVSVNAVAASVGMAYETVRERIETLCHGGLCERETGGVRLSSSGLMNPAFVTMWRETHHRFMITLQQIGALGLDIAAAFRLPATSPVNSPPLMLAARVIIDFEVRLLGHLVPTFGSVMRGHIWSAVLAFNLEHLLSDRFRAWRHATIEQEADASRRPVSIRTIALHLEQPYETTRRHMRALADAGAIVEVPGRGFYVPRPPVPNPPLDKYNTEMIVSFAQLMSVLYGLGFRLPALP